MSERRLVEIEIANYKAIESMKIAVGACTMLVGFNGQGKSSVLDAVQDIFDGGHDPRVIRGYEGAGGVPEAKQASRLLRLDDGTTIKKTTTRKSSTLTVTSADGGVVRPPKEYVDKLARSFGFDPIAFCYAKPAERVQWLLEVMPIKFTAGEINEAAGMPIMGPAAICDLEKLNQIIEGRRSQRTDANRNARDAEGTWDNLKRSLPADEGKDWGSEIDRLDADIRAANSRIAAARGDADREATRQKEEKRALANAEIEDLEAQIEAVRERFRSESAEIDAATRLALDTSVAEDQAKVAALKLDLGTARQKQDEAVRVATLRESAEQWGDKMVAANKEADALTRQIKALEDLKGRKIADLPVPGVDVRDLMNAKGEVIGKDVAVDGVIWEHVNDSEQIVVAMEIGLQGAGDLPLLLCDHGGEFDDERLKKLAEFAKDRGVQILMARAEPENLRSVVLA